MHSNGEWTDFVSDFMSFTEHELTTDLHRKWAAIATVAGALERRVWVTTVRGSTFPNLYVLLAAPPGIGKFVIEIAKELTRNTIVPGTTDRQAFHIAPDSVSSASLIDDLSKAKQAYLPEDGPPYIYHTLQVFSEEFEVLLPTYDPLIIGRMNSLYNNQPFYRETRRHGPARDVTIHNPQLNVLAGATPAYFTSHFPDEAWNTGLIRRLIIIFQADAPIKDIFYLQPEKPNLELHLRHQLSQMSALWGQATWGKGALEFLREWHMAGCPPEPSHSKLKNYVRNRTLNAIKLALISGVSRTGLPVLDLVDAKRAQAWLFEAEAFMPDLFREMIGKSDGAVIEELHYYMQALWIKNKQKPITTNTMAVFLGHRVPSEKINHVMQLAQSMDVIARVGGAESDLWIPRPKALHGVE